MNPRWALLLVIPLLAGCTGSAPPPAPVEPVQEEPAEPMLVNATEASNFTDNSEPGDFQRSLDEKFHVHNYWGDALEKTIVDADVPAGEMLPGSATPDALFTFMFRTIFLSRGGVGFTRIPLPDGAIVPPETNRVEATVTWAESPTITGLRLLYSNASSESLNFLDPFPAGGGTVTIDTDLIANDIPHTSVSKWRFFLAPVGRDNGGFFNGPGMFNGTAHVTIKVFRNDTLFVAPPHKDFWRENTTLNITDFATPAKETWAGFPLDQLLGLPAAITSDEDREQETGFGYVPLPNETIIPPHTGVLTVVLEWTNNSTLPNVEDLHPTMVFSPANTFRIIEPANAVRESNRITYTIEVDPRMVDSPYINETQWAFFVFLTSQSQELNPLNFPINVGEFDGFYRLTIVAEREAL